MYLACFSGVAFSSIVPISEQTAHASFLSILSRILFFVHIITRKFQSPHHAVFCIIPHRALIFN